MLSKLSKILISLLFFVNIFNFSLAQDSSELIISKTHNYKAEILEIKTISTSTKREDDNKQYTIKILEGDHEGEIKTLTSKGYDYEVGDNIFIDHTEDRFGDYWNIGEILRYDVIAYTALLFLSVVIILYGWKGARSLVSLALSLGVIFFVLLPLTLTGYNSVLVTIFVSILLLVIVMIFTHGYNKVTLSALLGCAVAVLVTIIISYIVIIKARFTGFNSEEATYLYYNTAGILNFKLLAISSFIIGVIGVVDDAAITQAGVVRELKTLDRNLSTLEYYSSAMRVGRDHAGSMINTLVLAYAGSSFSLLLLLYTGDTPLLVLLNKEIIATEIVRALVGSVGLLLAIPLSTLFACYLIKDKDLKNSKLESDHIHTHPH